MLQQVLEAGPSLACRLLPLLVHQDVQHLLQAPGNIRLLGRGVFIYLRFGGRVSREKLSTLALWGQDQGALGGRQWLRAPWRGQGNGLFPQLKTRGNGSHSPCLHM